MKLFVFTFSLLFSLSTVANEPVKKSSSGICHSDESPHYDRIKSFTSYADLSTCINSGGRLPINRASQISSGKIAAESGYSREQFGRGWADTDGDCQNSRHEALINQSTGPVRFKTSRECRVTAGRWISPFTGTIIHDPSKIDIDHLVPLKWAWDHGAYRWSRSQREHFANDPANLLSVEASLNRQKGAKGPSEWLPPANKCQYMLRFTRVMKTYQLKLSASEESQMAQTRSRVCD